MTDILDAQGNRILTKEEAARTEKMKGVLGGIIKTLHEEGLTDVQDCVVLAVNLILHGLNFIPPKSHELYAQQTVSFLVNSIAQASAAINEHSQIARNVMKTPIAH